MSASLRCASACLLLGVARGIGTLHLASQATSHGAGSAAAAGRAGLLAGVTAGAQHGTRAFNCSQAPELCKPPFNCQEPAAAFDQAKWTLTGVQKAQPRTWCAAPQYHTYASLCMGQQSDLVKAAHYQYERTVAGDFGPYTHEMDGSYCFIEGLCVNSAVSNSTTLAEAEELCDERYGAERWRSYRSSRFRATDLPGATEASRPIDGGRNGFSNRLMTEPYLIAACAMGNFHCDVKYCQETYCKVEYYQEKYGHYLKQFGWI